MTLFYLIKKNKATKQLTSVRLVENFIFIYRPTSADVRL